MKIILLLGGFVGILALVALFFVPSALWLYEVPPPGTRPLPPPPSIAAIRGISELSSTIVRIQDQIEGSNRHYKGVWSIHGDIILSVDLSQVAYVSTDMDQRTATLRLPTPQVRVALDHKASKEQSFTAISLPLSDQQRLRGKAWEKAAEKLRTIGEQPHFKVDAKANAERILKTLFAGVGWKVGFEWADAPLTASR